MVTCDYIKQFDNGDLKLIYSDGTIELYNQGEIPDLIPEGEDDYAY